MINLLKKLTYLPCSLSFKRDKILPQGVVYRRIEAFCKSCDSQLEGIVYGKSSDSNTIFHCTYMGNFAKRIGGKKRNIQGGKKRFERKLLKENKNAKYIRHMLAGRMMIGEIEPASLPSGNQLRALKRKFLDDNTIISLLHLKHDSP